MSSSVPGPSGPVVCISVGQNSTSVYCAACDGLPVHKTKQIASDESEHDPLETEDEREYEDQKLQNSQP